MKRDIDIGPLRSLVLAHNELDAALGELRERDLPTDLVERARVLLADAIHELAATLAPDGGIEIRVLPGSESRVH